MAGLAAGALLLLACSVGVEPDDEPRADGPAERGSSAPAGSVNADAATTADAIDQLRAGTAFVDQTSFRADVDIASQISTLSQTDNVERRAVSTVSVGGRGWEIRMIDEDVYMKTDLDLPGVGHDWMVLDRARVPSAFALSFEPGKNDPSGSARLINAIVTARADGPRISGTLDVTRIGSGNGISFRPGPAGEFPDSVRNQAFHASLDAEGRLVDFLIPEANGAPSASLRYSEFGAPFEVVRPDGAVKAPDALYPQLGLGG
ncbi:hypothetical protein D7193_27540 [Micromonospora costi]|uniref:LppX_LprAFG lipoprotein n=2 Tax=Micromonospora costi TaxID=1530042 RepID=A0A3A9ZTS2_9ACTN|nr:hypothetical protein D7193_27540 [Micromonospora costi]